MKLPTSQISCAFQQAFSLVEVMVGVGILGIATIALYAGFGSGFSVLQLTRENLRATQILTQRMETIRLYTWSQLHDPNYFPLTFTESFDPIAGANSVVYTGRVVNAAGTIAAPGPQPTASGLPDAYRTNMALVRIQVFWTSGNTPRQREIQTYVARYGIQNYIHN